MNLLQVIREAEAENLQALFDHCKALFSNTFLPSHDHLHHNRVWKNCIDLMLKLDQAGVIIPGNLPGQAIIASFFHDTGLINTRGEQHGKEGSMLCKAFFNDPACPVKRPDDKILKEVLHAIEHHDDKTPKNSGPEIREGSQASLLSLVSAADDMDAFGYCGIYRYAEIYLLRGILPEELPRKVSTNVRNRFENLAGFFSLMGDFIRRQEKRFRLVYDFYLRLGQAYLSTSERPTWEPVLIDIIHDSLLLERNLLSKDRLLPDTEFENEIKEWFVILDRELSEFSI